MKNNYIWKIKNINITGALFQINRNQRSQVRDSLAAYINEFSISNMDSIRTQAGMLSMLSSQTDEISRQTEVLLNHKRFMRDKTKHL